MNNSLTILVSTFNRSKLLERALLSLENQSDNGFSVLICDDCSSDDTTLVAQNFCNRNANWAYLRLEKNSGVNKVRNTGLNFIKTELVAFLDDDDEFVFNAVKIIKENTEKVSNEFNIFYFNSLILRGDEKIVGGFQFDKIKHSDNFYDPSYKETMTKFNLKGDCKPVFRKSLFQNKRYLFPETVNGFESYTMNLIAKDKKGIRYFKDITTIIHQEGFLKDRLSINAPRKNPWPLFVLHFKQIFEHFGFYMIHPVLLFRKKIEMLKLLMRSILALFNIIY